MVWLKNAIQRLSGLVRTLKDQLEAKIKRVIDLEHPIFSWILEWAADILNRSAVNKDGSVRLDKYVGGTRSAASLALAHNCTTYP